MENQEWRKLLKCYFLGEKRMPIVLHNVCGSHCFQCPKHINRSKNGLATLTNDRSFGYLRDIWGIWLTSSNCQLMLPKVPPLFPKVGQNRVWKILGLIQYNLSYILIVNGSSPSILRSRRIYTTRESKGL